MLENQSLAAQPRVPAPSFQEPEKLLSAAAPADTLLKPAPEAAPKKICSADELPVGSIASVVGVAASCPDLRHKLLSLGVVAGTRLEVLAVAPLGDPMNVRILGFTLSLRLCEAHCISVIKLA